MRKIWLAVLVALWLASATGASARILKPISLGAGRASANTYAGKYATAEPQIVSYSRVYSCDQRYATEVVCYADFRWSNGSVCTRYITVRATIGLWLWSSGSKGCTSPTRVTPSAGTYVIPGGTGYAVVCRDGSISNSGGKQGACSYHGGVSP